MKNWIHAALAGAVLAALAPVASADVVSFDKLPQDSFLADVGHYGGIDWSGSDWFAFNEQQDPYNAHSGDFRVVSGFGDADAATAFAFDAASVFQGAWFSGLSGADVTFQLFYQGVQVASSATLDPTGAPQFLSSGYDGLVDKVIVSSLGQGSYAMDDVTYVTPVPEPGTYALMLAGLGVVAVTVRRKNKSAAPR